MLKSKISKDGTIREYLDWINDIIEDNKRNQLFERTSVFYRGQCNKEWPIIPFAFRTENGEYREFDLYSQARSIAWSVISDCHTSLEQLVRLQHFGLPTRLIDVTHNPLVALFFACNGKHNKNGCVFWGTNEFFCNYRFAEVIAEEVMTNNRNGYNCKSIRNILPEFFKNIDEWSDSDRNNLQYCVNALSHPYYLLPPYNNSRIKAQKGAFIIPPLICTNGITNPDEDTEYFNLSNDIDYGTSEYTINNEPHKLFQPQTFIVRSKHKQNILTELKEIGIDRVSLFPDNIEALMEHIADSVRLPQIVL